jgi:hypothetical protein
MMALRLRVPTIYLVDCSGLFLPSNQIVPGARGAGHIFKMNSLLSASGVPQIAGVFGDCIAGGGYMPIISDRVYMTEQAYMVIAGRRAHQRRQEPEDHLARHRRSRDPRPPARAAPTCASPTTTPPRVPAPRRRAAAVERRRLLSRRSRLDRSALRAGRARRDRPRRSPRGLRRHQVLAGLVDQSLFWESCPRSAKR